jgi:hypothetical protein
MPGCESGRRSDERGKRAKRKRETREDQPAPEQLLECSK